MQNWAEFNAGKQACFLPDVVLIVAARSLNFFRIRGSYANKINQDSVLIVAF